LGVSDLSTLGIWVCARRSIAPRRARVQRRGRPISVKALVILECNEAFEKKALPRGTPIFSRRGSSVDGLSPETRLAAAAGCNALVRLEYLERTFAYAPLPTGTLAPRRDHYWSSFGLSAYVHSSLRRTSGRSCPLATISAANASSALTSAANGIPIV